MESFSLPGLYCLDLTIKKTIKQLANPVSYTDCVQWCLPDLQDNWNELLFACFILENCFICTRKKYMGKFGRFCPTFLWMSYQIHLFYTFLNFVCQFIVHLFYTVNYLYYIYNYHI
jgi:hypothetical protein